MYEIIRCMQSSGYDLPHVIVDIHVWYNTWTQKVLYAPIFLKSRLNTANVITYINDIKVWVKCIVSSLLLWQ